MYADIAKLKRAGYTVIQQSPWHFQVAQGDSVCNIWPTKRKYMREYGGGASIYVDVVRAVESVVGKPGIKETRAERIARLKKFWAEEIPVPRDPEADRVWRYELGVLVRYIHRRIQRAIDMDF